MPACSICTHPDTEGIEALGQQAVSNQISWRKAAAAYGIRDVALKNHMQRHVLAPEVEAAQAELADEMSALIEEAKEGLLVQFRLVPADVKPLILVAIQNLDGLKNTKPSMETLIRALKTVQEMTGMKNEQRLLLNFSQAMFKPAPLKVAPLPRELKAG